MGVRSKGELYADVSEVEISSSGKIEYKDITGEKGVKDKFKGGYKTRRTSIIGGRSINKKWRRL